MGNSDDGLMLLQVKASLKHGEWLPWLKAQRDAGAISFSDRTANDYMKLAGNPQRAADLPERPSIRAALELLTDEKPADDQPALAAFRQPNQEAQN